MGHIYNIVILIDSLVKFMPHKKLLFQELPHMNIHKVKK